MEQDFTKGKPSHPLVSCIVTLYQSSPFLGKLFESLNDQTYENLEIIAIDDASSPPLKEKIEELSKNLNKKLGYLLLPKNLGPSLARRAGLMKARGEYIQFIDVDDFLEPNKIALQVKDLEANPTWGMTYCLTDCIDKQGQVIEKYYGRSNLDFNKLLPDTLGETLFSNCSCLWRHDQLHPESWKTLRQFEEKLFFWLQGLYDFEIGKTAHSKALAHKRIHDASYEKSFPQNLDYFQTLIRVYTFFYDEWKKSNLSSDSTLPSKLGKIFLDLAYTFLSLENIPDTQQCLKLALEVCPEVVPKGEKMAYTLSLKYPNQTFYWKGLKRWDKVRGKLEL